MTQYIATALSLAGLYGIREKALWGPTFGAAGSLAWVIYGIQTTQWGLAATEVVFMLTYMGTWAKWAADAASQIRPGGL